MAPFWSRKGAFPGFSGPTDPEKGIIPPDGTTSEPLPPPPADPAPEYRIDDTPLHVPQNRPRGIPVSRFSTLESVIFVRPKLPVWAIWLRDVFFGTYDRLSDIPSYRTAPMISGALIPFAILLQIPGITEHWYVRTEAGKIVDDRPNPRILNVVIGVSFACAVVANIALLMRFFERRVAAMTVLAIVFLSIHGMSLHFCSMSTADATWDLPTDAVGTDDISLRGHVAMTRGDRLVFSRASYFRLPRATRHHSRHLTAPCRHNKHLGDHYFRRRASFQRRLYLWRSLLAHYLLDNRLARYSGHADLGHVQNA
jgi:hypothetical protein